MKRLILPLLLALLLPSLALAQTQLCQPDSAICVVPNDLDVGSDIKSGDTLGVQGSTGSNIILKRFTTLLTGLSGATVAATNLVPAGTILFGCTGRVTTAITGATSWGFGDGTTATKFGATLGLTAGTTSSSADFVAATTVATSAPLFYKTAMSPTLTANGSNFTAGAVRVTCYGMTMAGPTS